MISNLYSVLQKEKVARSICEYLDINDISRLSLVDSKINTAIKEVLIGFKEGWCLQNAISKRRYTVKVVSERLCQPKELDALPKEKIARHKNLVVGVCYDNNYLVFSSSINKLFQVLHGVMDLKGPNDSFRSVQINPDSSIQVSIIRQRDFERPIYHYKVLKLEWSSKVNPPLSERAKYSLLARFVVAMNRTWREDKEYLKNLHKEFPDVYAVGFICYVFSIFLCSMMISRAILVEGKDWKASLLSGVTLPHMHLGLMVVSSILTIVPAYNFNRFFKNYEALLREIDIRSAILHHRAVLTPREYSPPRHG